MNNLHGADLALMMFIGFLGIMLVICAGLIGFGVVQMIAEATSCATSS